MAEKNTLVCVGLDSDFDRIPEYVKLICKDDTRQSILSFNIQIIDETSDLVCAYKPQSAFYEAYGVEGMTALYQTVRYIKNNYPHIPVILDAKRADIGSTNDGYVKATFDLMGADAITVHPYLGKEALKPFLDRKDKGTIVLVRTSNPGAGEFQDLTPGETGLPLYQVVAKNVASSWNENGNCCVVVGATYPKELAEVREIVGNMPILIPGVGAQGGDVEAVVKSGQDSRGMGMIINSSRGIIFASKNEDFAQAARKATVKLRDEVNQYRQAA